MTALTIYRSAHGSDHNAIRDSIVMDRFSFFDDHASGCDRCVSAHLTVGRLCPTGEYLHERYATAVLNKRRWPMEARLTPDVLWQPICQCRHCR